MRIKCRYSGVDFVASGFNELYIQGSHPLMNVDLITLLARARDWAEGKLSSTERRVLFIALLKSTELVEFHRSALPPDSVIAKNMETLIRTMGWKGKLGDLLPLPKYAVTNDTYRLVNIHQWLKRCNDAKSEWENKDAVWERREELRIREERLIKLIRTPTKKLSFYQGMLGRWILEASNAPVAMHDYWLQLLRLKEYRDIWAASRVDLEELLEHMEDNLPAGSIIADVAFKHVRKLREINIGGVEFGLGMDDDNADLDFSAMRNNPFIMIEEIEEHNMIAAASFASKEEPKVDEFETKGLYLKAVARWRLAQRLLSENERLAAKQKELDFEAEVVQDVFSEIDPETSQEIEALLKNVGDKS